MPHLIEPASGTTPFTTDSSQIKLRKVSLEFESLLVLYMLKSEQALEVENSFFGKNKIIQSLFRENMAQAIAVGGGLGLGDMLFNRFSE